MIVMSVGYYILGSSCITILYAIDHQQGHHEAYGYDYVFCVCVLSKWTESWDGSTLKVACCFSRGSEINFSTMSGIFKTQDHSVFWKRVITSWEIRVSLTLQFWRCGYFVYVTGRMSVATTVLGLVSGLGCVRDADTWSKSALCLDLRITTGFKYKIDSLCMHPCPRSTKIIQKILCAHIFNLFVCIWYACLYACIHMCLCIWRPEDNLSCHSSDAAQWSGDQRVD